MENLGGENNIFHLEIQCCQVVIHFYLIESCLKTAQENDAQFIFSLLLETVALCSTFILKLISHLFTALEKAGYASCRQIDNGGFPLQWCNKKY